VEVARLYAVLITNLLKYTASCPGKL